MPDQPQCSNPAGSPPLQPPPDFEETAGFRESTLHLFPPEHADTLRRFGRLLHDLILDGQPYWPEGVSITRRELEAALADALHLRDFLWHVSREIEQSELSPDDSRLSLLARELVDAMDEVVMSLQEGLEGAGQRLSHPPANGTNGNCSARCSWRTSQRRGRPPHSAMSAT